MSDTTKTSIYVVVALLLAAGAYVARPRQEVVRVDERVGKPLFPDFQDPTKVASLEIVRYDEDLGEIHRFKVAKNSRTGLWTIPSHADYPADAEDRIRDAATIFVGLEVLGLVTQNPAEHQLFGVLEPDEDKLKLGDKGVGLLVSFEADKGKSYSLIIGKKIKGSEDHRFVRVPGQDLVYDIKIDPEKLSTKFEDWIEKDLLDLNTWDVETVRVKDYSLVETVQGTFLEPRFEIATRWNTDDSKWELVEFLTYQGRNAVPGKLLDTEELNKEKLDDLKYALDDLKIVDVARKPKGLGANLRAGSEFMNDRESRESLRSRGFYPNPVSDDEFELLATNGEVHVGLKDGVEYVLRFGNVAGTSEGEEGTLNRYLLVMARVDESKLPVPEPPEGLNPEDLKEEKEADDSAEKPADEDAEDPGAGESGDGNGDDEKPASSDDMESATDDAAADSDDEEAGDESEGGEQADETEDGAAEGESQEAEESDREKAAKEYQRELDEWKEKKDKAEKKVRELNARFADWYYVISEDVYKKIHLGRSDLIRETEEAKEEGVGVDAFRKLQENGVEKPADEESSSDDTETP